MTDMRNIINLVESMSNEKIDEAGFVSRMANKGLATLGNKRAQGKTLKDDLAKKMTDNYYRWLGRTNKKGTLADLQNFFQQINFTNDQINYITKSVITSIEQNPQQASSQNQNNTNQTRTDINAEPRTSNDNNPTNESILFELDASDFELSNSEITNIMDTAAAYAYEHGLYGKKKNTQSSNSESNSTPASNNTNQSTTSNRNGTVTRANLFTNSVINYLNDLGLRDNQIRDMAGAPIDLKFDQLDQTEKDMMAKIGYTLMKYNKTGLQQ